MSTTLRSYLPNNVAMISTVGRCSSSACRFPQNLLGIPPICRQCVQRGLSSSVSPRLSKSARRAEILDIWQHYRGVDTTRQGPESSYVGFLGKRRNVSKHLSFADLTTPSCGTIQVCSRAEDNSEAHAKFRQIPAHSPVLVHGQPPAESVPCSPEPGGKTTINLIEVRALNSVPLDLIVTPDVQFPPQKRHLQIRFHPELQARLRFRSWLKAQLNQALLEKDFIDVETPTLFKSTPEGAREFFVPTRQRWRAYALTQSPQQYKQALMASGIMRYMQWARCYRDEDSRADRQPEFTQLDMEWAFVGASTVRRDVGDIIIRAISALDPGQTYKDIRGEKIPLVSGIPDTPSPTQSKPTHRFTTLTFAECISVYGSDKPDLRIPSRIHAIKNLEELQQFVSMITHHEDPLIEAFAFSLSDCSPAKSRNFLLNFMDNLPFSIGENPDGKPQVLIYDSSKPMQGFSSLGFGYQKILDLVSEGKELKDGDLVTFQARPKPKGQYCAGSTKIGELRSALWKALVEQGLMIKPQLGQPDSLQFVWVTEFPMFKPVEADEPGQGGSAGISAAHHPFTAPLSQDDLELLFTDPLQARSAAYDLVLNGVEIGGGSERNHVAEVQEFIMRDVLKMPEERIQDFCHLFDALRSGCPPHAGFALGFDRMVALMSDTSTVRDVIAFPKTMKGEDLFVQSPSKVTNEQLEPYGLQLRVKPY